MANLNGEAPIQRIVKKKAAHGGHHGGAWKVAYADFVTAMMALFIVLWIMAQSQSIRQNVAQYFKNPGILPQSQGLIPKSDVGGAMPTPGFSQELQTPAPAPESVDLDKARLEETKKKIQEIIAQLPELEKIKDQIRLEITDEGLRIELMEKEQNRFFEVGSAVINPQAERIFGIIAKELSSLPNHLTMEGHTDSRPYGKQGYSNWELSADRANAARRLMEGYGIKDDQFSEVRGYADRRLLDKADPHDFKNRRVSIVVKYLDKDKAQALLPEFFGKPGEKKGSLAPPPPISLPVPGQPPAPPAAKPPQVGKPPQQSHLPAPAPPPGAARPAAQGKVEPPPAKIEEKKKTAAAPAPPPPGFKEIKPDKGPLEDNLNLQKEFMKLLPNPPAPAKPGK